MFRLIFIQIAFLNFSLSKVYPTKFEDLNRRKIDFRLPLAGGLAGGLTNALLYPIDTIKTIRQSNPDLKSSWSAIAQIRKMGFIKLYSGFLPASLGAIPSSSLYFGGYEASKRMFLELDARYKSFASVPRYLKHMASAAIGNILSSIIFVPKEVLKQKLQVMRTGNFAGPYGTSSTILEVVEQIYRTSGITGFYSGYIATLSRNIPSAMIRFTAYEELRILFKRTTLPETISYWVAGSLASILSSVATTPFDLMKTRIATGTIPPNTPLLTCISNVIKREGIAGLYVGIQPRILWAGLFGGVGFVCFETFKKLLSIENELSDYPKESLKSLASSSTYSNSIRKSTDTRVLSFIQGEGGDDEYQELLGTRNVLDRISLTSIRIIQNIRNKMLDLVSRNSQTRICTSCSLNTNRLKPIISNSRPVVFPN